MNYHVLFEITKKSDLDVGWSPPPPTPISDPNLFVS